MASGRYGALETWWHTYSSADWGKADWLLAEGGVGDIAGRSFGVISEGERQQVLLARALMSDPEFLLLDEPFAGLDLGARERLYAAGGSGHGRRQPPAGPRDAPLRGDPAGVHPRGPGAAGPLIASGPLSDVITSENVSTCFGVAVTVGCDDGRWWSRAI